VNRKIEERRRGTVDAGRVEALRAEIAQLGREVGKRRCRPKRGRVDQ